MNDGERWEYCWAYVPDHNFPETIEYLNKFGIVGWEFTGHSVDSGSSMDYLMKRPMGPIEEQRMLRLTRQAHPGPMPEGDDPRAGRPIRPLFS